MKNLKYYISIICVFLLTLTLLSSCTAHSDPAPDIELDGYQPAGELHAPVVPSQSPKDDVFGLGYEPNGINNPLSDKGVINQTVYGLVYEGLFKIAADGSVTPLLCRNYFTSDGLTYTINLRSDVAFHDGSPLTADDVVYSLNEAKNYVQTLHFSRLSTIHKVTAVDENTVLITLSKPNGHFAAMLSCPILKDPGRQSSDSDLPPVGTGPYMYASENIGNEGGGLGLKLVSFDNWWKKEKLPFYSILLVSASNIDQYKARFEDLSIDLFPGEHISSSTMYVNAYVDEWEYISNTLHYLGFNTSKFPWNTNEGRAALASLTDRVAAVVGSGGYGEEALYPYPLQTIYYPSRNPPPPLSSPLSEFTKLGIVDSDGDGILDFQQGRQRLPLKLTILVNSESELKVGAARGLAASFKKSGILADVLALDFNSYLKALEAEEFDLYYAQTSLSPDFDITPLFTMPYAGGIDYGKYYDLEFSQLLEKFRLANFMQSPSAAAEISAEFMKKAPYICLFFEKKGVYTRYGMLENVKPSMFNLYSNLTEWKTSY